MDHDKWKLDGNKYDLIVSNLYIHLTNNFETLLKNINNSLNKNGFFIAAIPSSNCFYEIKECMILADLNLYNGAYKRFNETPSVNKISLILKKYNYKIPVFEIDVINLKYQSFCSLLNDIRYLGLTNISFDRKKKFEIKNYFNKVEEIYWNKFSYNNELQLKLEIIYITGWKDDISQQKPLKPGEAKKSLKEILI